MIPYQIIRKKQAGLAHGPDEIRELVSAFTSGELPDYQMSAWLMAVYFQGMTDEERQDMVSAVIASGTRLDFSHLEGFVADKHSTGGVGDKVSLILAPLVAACGIYVPMVSGRGLGHTGGTLDKLETIPGFRTDLDLDTFKGITEDVGACLIGQTSEICPADKKMYALRDVTATVESIPLIVTSIMSKKIAEGIQGLVLDVKTGSGAFMQSMDDARTLARALTETGDAFGVRTVARITDMSQPLGRTAGLWCEVRECLDVLEGGGPDDLRELSLVLSGEILAMAGINSPRRKLEEALSSGKAREKFDHIVKSQGGNPKAMTNKSLHQPAHTVPLKASESGYLAVVDTYAAGMSLTTAGAGRTNLVDNLDPTAGFALDIKIGDNVLAGQEIGRYFGADQGKTEAAARELIEALVWSEIPVESKALILG